MRILDRYILRELIVPFLLGIAVFTSILVVIRILKLVEMVVNRGVPLSQILKLFSYILPALRNSTIAMTCHFYTKRAASSKALIKLGASGASMTPPPVTRAEEVAQASRPLA